VEKFLSSVALIVFILSINCTVNEKTGLIQIQNKTVKSIANIKIGDKTISAYTASGTTVNYWYYETIKGKLTSDGISIDVGQSDWSLNLKPGYWVYITAGYNSQAGDDIVSISVYKNNSVQSPPSEWRDN
jgi:hypothetical protein